MQSTEVFPPAKDKGGKVLQIYGWHVSSFYEGIREHKDAICSANMLFHSQSNAGVDLEHTKRFKRSSWKESDLWMPGSQARKRGWLLVYRGHTAAEEGAKQLSVLFRQARATQTWPACQIHRLFPLSSEIIMVCFPFFYVLSTILLFLRFSCWHMDQSL